MLAGPVASSVRGADLVQILVSGAQQCPGSIFSHNLWWSNSYITENALIERQVNGKSGRNFQLFFDVIFGHGMRIPQLGLITGPLEKSGLRRMSLRTA
jgi:hypothetical protein